MHVRVRCRLFARYAEVVGVEDVDLDVPEPATVADAVALLRGRLPQGHLLPVHPLVARNQAHALAGDLLADGDELAILPPLAGG